MFRQVTHNRRPYRSWPSIPCAVAGAGRVVSVEQNAEREHAESRNKQKESRKRAESEQKESRKRAKREQKETEEKEADGDEYNIVLPSTWKYRGSLTAWTCS